MEFKKLECKQNEESFAIETKIREKGMNFQAVGKGIKLKFVR